MKCCIVKIKKNQVIMTEGVLPYVNSDGTVSYKLKKWSNIKELIGKLPYITNEHPSSKSIDTNTKLFGNVSVHQCPNGVKSLCGVVNLDENAPEKLGYSPGYSYIERDESGVFEGKKYDAVQEITRLDHIALTDYPRNMEALATDKKENYGTIHEDLSATIVVDSSDNGGVNINKFAYDSVRPFELKKSSDKTGEDKIMPDDIKELNKIINTQNKQLAKYEAQNTANDAFKKDIEKQKKEIDSLKAENKKITSAYDSMKLILETQQKEKMTKAIDSLVKVGVDAKTLKGKSWDYIQGRVEQLAEDSKNPSTDVEIKNLGADGNANPPVMNLHNINDYIWDGDKWGLKPGVKP